MSASTVAIAANQAVNNNPSLALGVGSRRRNVAVTEKKSSNIEMVAEGGGGVGVGISDPMSGDGGRDLSHTIRGETPLDRQRDFSSLQTRKGLTNSTVSPRRRKVVPKPVPEKPLWQTVMSVFTKNLMLLLVLLGLVQMIRKLALKSGEVVVSTVGITEFESRIAEVEAFLKTTTKMMQVQVEVMDKKIESEVGGLRREVTKKVEEKGVIFENALKKLESKTDGLDKSLGELKAGSFFTKEDFDRFSDELKKKSTSEGNNKENWSLDEIRAVAKEIVEKEIERHAADGLGKVDYAVYSGGGRVVDHSEHYRSRKGVHWLFRGNNIGRIHPDAQRILEPSFGEPGQCLPLDSSSGFVVVRLRSAIIPEAITLDHIAKATSLTAVPPLGKLKLIFPISEVCAACIPLKNVLEALSLLCGKLPTAVTSLVSVAYDRSTAPKNCQVSGWYEEYDSVQQPGQVPNLFKLVEFVYDLDRSASQTFNVNPSYSGIVNTVRLDFRSNHGAGYTCLYRLRVHGREPDAVAISKL